MVEYRFQGADTKYIYAILEKDGKAVEVAIKGSNIDGDLFQTDEETGEATSTYVEENFDALYNSANPIAQQAYMLQLDEYLIDLDFRQSLSELGVGE